MTGETAPSTKTAEAINCLKERRMAAVLECDAISHHVVCGRSNVNLRGRAFLEYLESTDLEMLNQGAEPPSLSDTRREIYLTLRSSEQASGIHGWSVSPEQSLLDH
jgi:hypothetical protein